MPGPKECSAKGLIPGTKEYEDCIAYKGKYGKKGNAKPLQGSLRSPNPKGKVTGGGY